MSSDTSQLDYGSSAETRDSSRSLLSRGIVGITDQGIVSLGNFITTLILARRLDAGTFGTYFILFQLLLVLNNLQDSLVTYPLTVRGAKIDAKSFRKMLAAALAATLLLCIGWSIAVAVGVIATASLPLLPWIIAAMVLWQVQELLRRGMMAQHRFAAPIPGDIVSFLGQAAMVFLLISPSSSLHVVVMIMAGTSLLAAVIQLIQTRPTIPTSASTTDFMTTGWSLGRWLLLNNLLGMINIQLVVWVTGYLHKAPAVATLGAVMSILAITHPVLLGLTRLIVPSVARASHNMDRRSAIKQGVNLARLGGVILVPIYLAIAIAPTFVLSLFYAGKYADAALPLRLFAITYLVDLVGRTIESTLNGLEENRSASIANLFAAVATLLVTLPLIYFYSLNGAMIGMCISVLARATLGLYFLGRPGAQPDPLT